MAGDDPPYLNVGTDVSAKYRGAFCEAKVKKLVRCVKCKIFLKETQSSVIVVDENVKGNLKIGAVVELKHPESSQNVEGTITRLTDSSMYTVVFNDGDEKTLRRTQLCLKGEKHFIESETLDNLPLSHPEHFGTPVMHEKKIKRGRHSAGNGEETEDPSSDESLPKRAEYKGRLQQLVGKVMMTEMSDKRRTQTPVLVVLPDAHSLDLKTKDHLMVKSFKDNKFHSVLRKDLKEFTKELSQKNEDKGLKSAFEKALGYYENQELPNSWERDELLGTDEEEISDDDESSDEEQCEEKDRFVAQLYKFMDDRGTPINKGPYLGNKDLNLYRLFKIVQNLGGYNKVTNQMKWKGVYTKLNIQPSSFAYDQVKNAYKKYLHAFEDFYRKLGSTMGTISRPGRSRNNSGRSVVVFKKDKYQDKSDEKESDDQKDDEEDSSKSNDEATSKRDRSPQKRVMRHDLITKEDKTKKDESKDKKEEEETPKKSSKKETTAKKEDSAKKQTKVAVKKEDEKKSTKKDTSNEEGKKSTKKDSDEEKDKDDKTQQQKKVIRRRSMRKDEKEEDVKEDDKDDTKKEKQVEKDNQKSKNKTTTPAKEDKKEKKEEKEKPKLTRKDAKKTIKPEEDHDTEKSKTTLKREVKKMRGEEDIDVAEKSKGKESSTVKKDVKKEEPEATESKPVSVKKESKLSKVDKEKPKMEDEDTDSKGSEDFLKDVDSKITSGYPNGTKLQVRYGRGRNQKVYDAKIVEAGLDGVQYLVHYAGWNNRYDEWIKPERIVNVLNRPETEKSKRNKESSPKICKPPTIIKKRGRSGMTPPHPSTTGNSTAARPTIHSNESSSPPVLVKSVKSPASAAAKQNKSRPTRSNSVEVKMMDGLPPKMRRTRRSSGVTESSDVNSQGSDMDESYQSDEDIDIKEAFTPDHPDLDEEDMSIEYEENPDDPDSDLGTAEMPKLDHKVTQEDAATPLQAEEKEEKMDPTKTKTQDSKIKEISEEIIDAKVETSTLEEQPEEKDFESAPKLVAIKPNPPGLDVEEKDLSDVHDAKEKQKDVFKWDLDDEEEDSSNKTCNFVTEILDSIQSESDISETTDGDMPPVIAPVLEKCNKEEIPLSPHVDKPAPEIRPEIVKPEKSQAQIPIVDDRFEFRDDEEEITLPDLRAETEKELKERQKHEVDLLEKKVLKGKKRDTKDKKEVKEKKEVRKGKMTMAERKLVILPDGANEVNFEPPLKKSKEEKLEDKTFENNSVSLVEEAVSCTSDKVKQMATEENETEKKKVKKKVKKKCDTGEVGEGKKDTGKTSKTPKGDKAKAKTKKSKDISDGDNKCEEQLLDSATGLLTKPDAKQESDALSVLSSVVSESSSNRNKPVIKYESAIDLQTPVLSGVELLSGVAIMKENENNLDPKDQISATADGSLVTNTVLDNTPPTTPEHDNMDSAPCPPSQEHLSQEPLKVSEINNEHDQQFVSESPTGNASPSSNDGSVGSGNVACSESSNTDAPAPTSLGKRRRESDEATPKKKRKGKSKGNSERKSSKQTTVPTIGSDSDEAGAEHHCSPPIGSTSPGKLASSTNSPRPSKYNLNLEEGKYLEGEKRITFLMEKIQEIRKMYMNLKSEVACIDRRRKRARRKERERDCVQSSSTAAENECSR